MNAISCAIREYYVKLKIKPSGYNYIMGNIRGIYVFVGNEYIPDTSSSSSTVVAVVVANTN